MGAEGDSGESRAALSWSGLWPDPARATFRKPYGMQHVENIGYCGYKRALIGARAPPGSRHPDASAPSSSSSLRVVADLGVADQQGRGTVG